MIRSVLYICRGKKKEKEAHHTLHKIVCRVKKYRVGYVFLKKESSPRCANYTQSKRHMIGYMFPKKESHYPRYAKSHAKQKARIIGYANFQKRNLITCHKVYLGYGGLLYFPIDYSIFRLFYFPVLSSFIPFTLVLCNLRRVNTLTLSVTRECHSFIMKIFSIR
jgi:hypothetical protein